MLITPRALTVVLGTLVLGAYGCGSASDGGSTPSDGGSTPSDGRCTPPAAVTYSCDPLPPGTPGCRGTPRPYADHPVPDPDAAFPHGCIVTFPLCNRYYASFVAHCECSGGDVDGGASPAWGCPL